MKEKILDENEISQAKKIGNSDEIIIFKYPLENYVEFLEKCIDSYNYIDDFSDCLFLFSIISHIMTTTEIKKKTKREIYEKLKSLRGKIKVLILQKPGEINKTNPNFILLKKIIDQIESLIVAGFYDMVEHYQGNNLQLIEYLLFEVRDHEVIRNVFEQYPYMIRFMDDKNEKLVQKVIRHYMNEIDSYTINKELNGNSNVIYYDKLLTLFLNHPKLEFDFQEKMDAINMIQNFRKQIKSEDYNDLTKRKLVFWLNHLEEQLCDQQHEVTFHEICFMHDIKTKFDEGILSEVRRINKDIKPNQYPNRRLIQDEYIVTIDGNGTQEIDDGLSIKKLENGYYRLGIHIADPTSYFLENSIILDEAFKRTTSIYLNNQTIFMFPEVLAKDKMSLLAGKPRLATSYYLYINEQGRIESYEFLETIVKVHNITYEQADFILKSGNCENLELLNTLIMLSTVTNKFQKNFTINPMYKMVNRSQSNPSNTNIITPTKASKIVETCMMMTNYIVPFHMQKHNLPCVNRVHVIDQSYLEKISGISETLSNKNDPDSIEMINYLKSFYPKAKYSTDKLGHFGLGLPIYSHVTAPLRRGMDNIQKLYVLDPFYFHPVEDFLAYQIEDKLKDICTYFNERANIIESFVDYQKSSKVLTRK